MAGNSEDGEVTLETIDLGGDTKLMVGLPGDQVCLLVSVPHLSLASAFFKTLFSRPAQTIKRDAEGNPANKRIKLEDVEENDAQAPRFELQTELQAAAVLLCRILHMRYDASTQLTPAELLSLATVTDQYGCIESVRLTVSSLLPQDTTTTNNSMPLRDLIVAAYLFDLPILFEKYTSTMVYRSHRTITHIGSTEEARRIPALSWLTIEGKRAAAYASTISLICSLTRSTCPGGPYHVCQYTDGRLIRTIHQIRAAGLDRINNKTSVESLIAKVAAIRCEEPLYVSVPCGFTHGPAVTDATLQEGIQKIRDRCTGLCLDCMRANRTGNTATEGCRISH